VSKVKDISEILPIRSPKKPIIIKHQGPLIDLA